MIFQCAPLKWKLSDGINIVSKMIFDILLYTRGAILKSQGGGYAPLNLSGGCEGPAPPESTPEYNCSSFLAEMLQTCCGKRTFIINFKLKYCVVKYKEYLDGSLISHVIGTL